MAPLSPRLNNSLRSLVSMRVLGMNMQGTGKYVGFFVKQEIYTTVFIIEVSFGTFKWTIRKLFDECRHFLGTVFPFREDEFDALFPNVVDSEDDTFALVERKENMEKFLREIVTTMDFLVYRPLFYFLNPHDEFRSVERRVVRIQSAVRMHFTRKKLVHLLGVKYISDLKRLTGMLLKGLKIKLLVQGEDGSLALVNRMLWLREHEGDAGLSRLCCSTMAEFFAIVAHENEDGDEAERGRISGIPVGGTPVLAQRATGLYLSDIAEIRCSLSSFQFSRYSAAITQVATPGREGRTDSSASEEDEGSGPPREADCLAIIGTECTLNVQLLGFGEDESPPVLRDWFVDTLSLLAMKSMGPEECYLRNKRWGKCSYSWWLFSASADRDQRARQCGQTVDAARKQEAEIFSEVLLGSIQVEEEVIDRARVGSLIRTDPVIEARTMWLDMPAKRFFIDSTHHSEGHPTSVRQGLDVDDIAEIRPGRMSFSCDGTSHLPSLTIVGSETCISLPLDSVAIRNALLHQFQSFLMIFRNGNRSAYRSSMTVPAHVSTTATISPTTPSRSSQLQCTRPAPRRRQSTPASLNKGFSRKDNVLWVGVGGHSLPKGLTTGTTPEKGYDSVEFRSSRRHSTGVTPSRNLLREPCSPDVSSNLEHVLEFEDDAIREHFKKADKSLTASS